MHESTNALHYDVMAASVEKFGQTHTETKKATDSLGKCGFLR